MLIPLNKVQAKVFFVLTNPVCDLIAPDLIAPDTTGLGLNLQANPAGSMRKKGSVVDTSPRDKFPVTYRPLRRQATELRRYGFFFFLSFGLSEKSNQASTTKPIATPVTASHVPSLSISSSCVEVLVA